MEPGRKSVVSGETGAFFATSAVAVALREEQFAVLDDGNDRAGDVGVFDFLGHEAVEECAEVVRGQFMRLG